MKENDVLQELQGDSSLFQVLNDDIQIVWTGFNAQVSQHDDVEAITLFPPLKEKKGKIDSFRQHTEEWNTKERKKNARFCFFLL